MSLQEMASDVESKNLPTRLASVDYEVLEAFEGRHDISVRGHNVSAEALVAAAWRGADRAVGDCGRWRIATSEKAVFEGALEEVVETFPEWFAGDDSPVTEGAVTRRFWSEGDGVKVGGRGVVDVDDQERVAVPVAAIVAIELDEYITARC